MGEGDKTAEIDIFTQLEDALEERLGSDRRKKNIGKNQEGEDRRKNDRRQQAED